MLFGGGRRYIRDGGADTYVMAACEGVVIIILWVGRVVIFLWVGRARALSAVGCYFFVGGSSTCLVCCRLLFFCGWVEHVPCLL